MRLHPSWLAGLVVAAVLLPAGTVRAQQKKDPREPLLLDARDARQAGRFEEAVRLCDRALALEPEATDGWTAFGQNEKGYALMELALYGDADPCFAEALRLYQNLRQTERIKGNIAQVLHNQAALCQRTARYDLAETLYQKSAAIHDALPGDVALFEKASTLKLLAELHRQTGRQDKAAETLRQSRQIIEQLWNKKRLFTDDSGKKAFSVVARAEAGILNSLGRLHRDKHNLAQAEKDLLESIALWDEYGPGTLQQEEAAAHNDLAWIHFDQGQLDKAEPHLRRALDGLTAKFGSNNLQVARAQSNLGLLNLARGRPARALELFQAGLDTRLAKFDKLYPDHPDLALSHYNLALAQAARQSWPEAVKEMTLARRSNSRYLGQTLPFLGEEEQLAELGTMREDIQAALSLGLAQPRDKDVAARSAEWALNSKGLSVEVLAAQTLLFRDHSGKDLEDLLRVRTDLANMTLAGTAAPGQLNRLRKQEAALIQRLSLDAGRVGRDPWVDLERVRQALPADAVLIEFARINAWDFRSGKPPPPGGALRYAAWVIPARNEGDVRVFDLGPSKAIDKAAADVGRAMDGAPFVLREKLEPAAEQDLRKVLRQVEALTLAPLRKEIDGRKRWIISPDALLWQVPWAALPGAKKVYAVEEHPISLLVSGRDLVREAPQVARPGPPLVLANAAFNLDPQKALAVAANLPEVTRGAVRGLRGKAPALRGPEGILPATFDPLPGSQQEAEKIAPLLKKFAGEEPVLRTREKALEAVVKTTHSPRVLVLSTHGLVLDPKKPGVNPMLLCGLVLAGYNERHKATPGQDDGFLTGLEIVGADLRGTELVVLSACESSLGKVQEGEGVASLRQAFHLAGARSVAATLWKIPDEETAELMEQFWTGMADRLGKADALQAAQVRMIQKRRDEVGAAHPLFWAAFSLSGDFR
jgi:CHAT domain-containing protein/tetratricopeptide (TPR) repeat protein